MVKTKFKREGTEMSASIYPLNGDCVPLALVTDYPNSVILCNAGLEGNEA